MVIAQPVQVPVVPVWITMDAKTVLQESTMQMDSAIYVVLTASPARQSIVAQCAQIILPFLLSRSYANNRHLK
jgi:hypothetical protein